MRRASIHGMLFEAANEDSARRVAEALVAAEAGTGDAWRTLNEGALYRLRTEADNIVVLVPVAFLRLIQQLVTHPRSAVRLDAVRYATLAYQYTPGEAEAA